MGNDDPAGTKKGASWGQLAGEVGCFVIMLATLAGMIVGVPRCWDWMKHQYNGRYGSKVERADCEAKKQLDEALEAEKQREAYVKECAEKGLRFIGTVGDKVECRP